MTAKEEVGATLEPGSEQGKELVTISVNKKQREIHRGRQTVSAIKTVGDVPQADVLEELVNGKLQELPDDGSVVLKGGEIFVSHPRDSSSS